LDVIGAALMDKGDESVIILTGSRIRGASTRFGANTTPADGMVMVHAVTTTKFQPSSGGKPQAAQRKYARSSENLSVGNRVYINH